MIQKIVKATGDSVGNKIADKIIRVLNTPSKNNSETNEEETLRGKYVSPELKLLMT